MKCQACDVRLRSDNVSTRWVDTCKPCAEGMLRSGREVARQAAQRHADALRACMGAVSVTVTDGDTTAVSKAGK